MSQIQAILATQFPSYAKGRAMYGGASRSSDILNEPAKVLSSVTNAILFWERAFLTLMVGIVLNKRWCLMDSFLVQPTSGSMHTNTLTWSFSLAYKRCRFHRTMTRPFFSRDRISDFDIFEKHAEDAIHQMKIRLREGYPVDFEDVASRFTLDSATEFLFGKDVRSLSAGIVYPPSSPLSKDPTFLDHPANRFVRAFMESESATAYRTNYGSSWRFAEFWRDQVQKHMKVCYEFIDPIIVDALAKKHEQRCLGVDVNDSTGEVKEGETLLEHLVNYTEGRDLRFPKRGLMY